MAYILNTPDDERAMLSAIGLKSLDDLFDMVPPEHRLNRPLAIPPALTELELTSHVTDLAAKNQGADLRPCFLGGGCYDHFVPAVVDALASRGEFYTAYTPYQAEASQGTLQATFEYQTLITQMTGLDVSNASLYDGGSAVAEAVLMAMSVTRREGRVVVAGTVHPEYHDIARTVLANLELEVVSVATDNGRVDPKELAAAVTPDTAAVVLQYPNFFGGLEDIQSLVDAAHSKGALAIVSVDPISLGLLRRPDTYGADIVVGEGQCLGNYLAYGGPYLGILACREEYVRKMPGRVVGANHRPSRQPLLGPHAANARAAHPSRESHVEHLHESRLTRAPSQHLPRRNGSQRAPRSGRTLDPQSPLRGRTLGRHTGSVDGLRHPVLQGVHAEEQEARESCLGKRKQGGLPRRNRPRKVPPRMVGPHFGGRHREADQGRDRRLGRSL